MVTERGQAKIMDFGLTRVMGGMMVTQKGTTTGTVQCITLLDLVGQLRLIMSNRSL